MWLSVFQLICSYRRVSSICLECITFSATIQRSYWISNLMPSRWYELIDSLRCKRHSGNGMKTIIKKSTQVAFLNRDAEINVIRVKSSKADSLPLLISLHRVLILINISFPWIRFILRTHCVLWIRYWIALPTYLSHYRHLTTNLT
jgi:hypothetical protein